MASRNRVNDAIAEERPSRRPPKLGQHFLADRGTAEKIVSALGVVAAETVVEIGSGKGVLTTILARNAFKLIAIELDRVLAAQLRMKYAAWPNVEIIEGDILKIDISTVLGPRVRNPDFGRRDGDRPYRTDCGYLPPRSCIFSCLRCL